MLMRMQSEGMRTPSMANVLGISEDAVVAALVKRRRTEAEGGDGGGTDASGRGQEAEPAAALVRRLSTDPLELCCPLLHSLMEDPVVA